MLSHAAAGIIDKLNNGSALNLGSSWVGGVAPGANDIAQWSATVSSGITNSLGADASWLGLKLTNPGGAVAINAGNTLTLGASGVDMTLATTNLNLNGPVTLGASQTWNIASNQTLAAGGVLVGAVSVTLSKAGSGNLIVNSGVGNANSVGTLQATAGGIILASGTLNVTASGGGTNFVPTLYLNGGTLTVAGGTLIDTAGYWADINNGGILSVTSGTCNITGNAELINGYGSVGTINLSGSGILNVNVLRISQGMGTVNLNGGTLQLNRFNSAGGTGVVNFNGTTVQAKTSLTNFTPLGYTYSVQSGGAIFDTAGSSITVAAPLTHDAPLGSTPDGGLTKQGVGTLTFTGTNTYTGRTMINGGTLALNGGTLAGAVSVASGATLQAGLGGTNFATLAMNSSPTLGGTLVMHIARNGATLANDRIQVAGGLTYGGTLIVSNSSSGYLQVGDTFQLFSAGSFAGAFTNIVYPPGCTCSQSLATDGKIVVTSVQTQTWNNGSGNFVWDTSSLNWSGVAWTAGKDAVFGPAGLGTITVSGVQTVGTGSDTPLIFNTAGYTLTNGSLTLPGAGNTNTIAVNADVTIASAFSCGGTLVKAGSGNLILNPGAGNTNTVAILNATAGGITLASGTLNVNANSGPMSIVPTLYLNGGTLTVAGGTLINTAGNYADINNGGALSVTSGTCNINNNAELINGYGSVGTINLSGSGVLNVNVLRISQGTGTVNLNGGTLQLNRFNSAGGTGTVNFNGTTVQAKSSLTNFTPLGYTYSVQSGGAIFDTAGNSIMFAAPLTHDNTLGSTLDGGLTKQGVGTLTFTGTNTYTGPTTINSGILAVNGLVIGTSGLRMSSNSTLQVAVGAPTGQTNIVVNGSVTLAGQISVSDFGIVSNTIYPVIYYSGNLTNNGITVAPMTQWAVTIDTSVPHLVRLGIGQKYPLVQFSNTNFNVSTLTTNLTGVLHGSAAGPIWYEVRDQTNRLWDYGALAALTPWYITVRHLRVGTNTVTILAQDGSGVIQSNRLQLNLTLDDYPGVRSRPIPAEIWWGGSCHNDNFDASGDIINAYSRTEQLTNTMGWDFVKRWQDGFFLHGYVWVNGVARMTNWAVVGAAIASQLAPFNGRFMLEDGWRADTNNMNYGHSSATAESGDAGGLLSCGLVLSDITQDYNPQYINWSLWNPTWPTQDLRVAQTGNTNAASPAYHYASGQWRDFVTDYKQLWPSIKMSWTCSPVWFSWSNYPSLGNNMGSFSFTQNGTNYSFNWNFYDFMNDAVVVGNSVGSQFGFASDCPWEYFGLYPGNPGGWSRAWQLTNRQKIRAYEAWLWARGLRHNLICNSYVAGGDTNDPTTWDLTYESNSLATLYLHQQEGGRAPRYLFESWFSGPYVLLPETQSGTYSHLALSAIKYLKGIKDTNGTLEQLSITPTATNGTVVQLQLQNNGDVQCLPTLAGQPGTVPGVTTRYFATNGAEITATVLTAEGICYTNLLQPGAATNLFAVTLASSIGSATNDNAYLEAFWNPQDPLGVVRDREIYSPALNPLGSWSEADIGSVGVIGGSALSGTNFTLLGSGADIWGTADAFHLVWQTNHGDGIITARVSSQTAADGWSKAGVMIRESTATNSRNVMLCITPNNGLSFQNRAATGGASYNTSLSGIAAPYWVRLTRSGATFTALCSSNGVTWVTVGSSNLLDFPSVALWGLAVTAHNNALASAATFDNVPTQSPGILTQPQSQFIQLGSNVTFSVSAIGDQPLYYQWQKNGINLADGGNVQGCTNVTLTVGSLSASDAGMYSVIVSNANGAVTSVGAFLAMPVAVSMGQNMGFEIPNLGKSFQYNPTGAVWTFTGGSGISGMGSAFTLGNSNAPEGVQVAFAQGAGSLISQTMIFASGSYGVIFSAKQRTAFSQAGQTFNVTLDGQMIGTYAPPESVVNYVDYRTGVFTVANGSHTLAFVGTDSNGGDNTIFIDNVRVISTAPLQLLGAGFFTNGGFRLAVQGQPGQAYTLQASTDLVNWVSILNFACTNLAMYVVDPGAKYYSHRFYRLAQGSLLLPVSSIVLGFNLAPPWSTNGFALRLQGPSGLTYLIEASTNLVSWFPVTSVLNTNSSLLFIDSQARNFRQRFYRAVMQ